MYSTTYLHVYNNAYHTVASPRVRYNPWIIKSTHFMEAIPFSKLGIKDPPNMGSYCTGIPYHYILHLRCLRDMSMFLDSRMSSASRECGVR